MKEIQRIDLDPTVRAALLEVEGVLDRSHCPFSGLCVAAGLVLRNGGVVTGVNYESASYGLTLCAERTALARAQAEGRIMEATALVLSARWTASAEARSPLTPCGACRQWLAELGQRLGTDFPVYSFWNNGETGFVEGVNALLPHAFK